MSPLNLSQEDLAPYADLGTSVDEKRSAFLLTRNGNLLKVEPHGCGYALTFPDGTVQRHPSAGNVLASEAFADLSRVAQNQVILLKRNQIHGRPVPINSNMRAIVGEVPEFSSEHAPWNALDDWFDQLRQSQVIEGTDLLLIDGPAGVGKTTIIRETALRRAEKYNGTSPLLLQIASRGRVLQNISDLIAFTLQDVRSNLTVNQLRPLMRHGLIILAIDGFDELSDPNGFKTAWSGLNNLIAGARGMATFLLAGRETFVSTETMRRQLTCFEAERDRLSTLSLADPDPDEAREWLLNQNGWDRELLGMDFVGPIFDQGSYALRPFFLDLIAREPNALRSDETPAPDLLSYLVDVMTLREAHKFVDGLDPPEGVQATNTYGAYVRRFLEEVARDLAENQSDAISEDALDLLASVAADGLLPDDQVAAVVQRARTVVFLANDLHAGHVRFAHEQLSQHFLAREALRSVGDGETPRYLRRNVFGREALQVFANVARGRGTEAERFLCAVRRGLAQPSRDRTHSNLAVLGVAVACAAAPEDADLGVRGVGISELHFPFPAPIGIVFRDTTISILHASSADIRNVIFESGVYITTLEIDEWSRLAESTPQPYTLVHPGGTTADPNEIQDILAPNVQTCTEQDLHWHEDLAELLSRIERYRSFWLRARTDDADRQGQRIVSHPDWPRVYDALKEMDLVNVKTREASGRRSDFVHFRQGLRLIDNAELFRRIGT